MIQLVWILRKITNYNSFNQYSFSWNIILSLIKLVKIYSKQFQHSYLSVCFGYYY